MSALGSYSRHDIRHVSFEDFVAFLFDHDVVPVPRDKNAGPFPWYWSVTVDYDPRAVIAYYTRLFAAPRFLLAQFPVDQLEQGFWAMQRGPLDCSVSEVIWERAVPFADRESWVRVMFELFAQLFDGGPLESSVDMWWDSLAELIQGYLSRNTAISPDLRDYALAAARFEVM
jgi:hypothetical protein